MLRVGEECRRSRKGYQILFYLFTRNLATGKCQEISDLFLQVLGGSQSFYVLPRSLSLTFTSETLQGDPHPQNSIYYLITKTAVAVKKKKKERKKERKKSVQFPGHPRIPKADPTGKTFTNSHSRRGSTPKIKIQSGFLKLVLLWSISEFSFILFPIPSGFGAPTLPRPPWLKTF